MPTAPAYYNVEVVQFWRGQKAPGRPYPLHWAIHIPTGPGIGHTYQIIGNTDNYTLHFQRNQPHQDPDAWRGSFTVGRLPVHQLAQFEALLANIPVMRNEQRWNCQNWVWDGLRYLRQQGFHISWEITLAMLQTQMCCLLESWEYGHI
ncbi:hypothetical protein K503DRAFT_799096 [Rhizopogon vinicolor AM-OR11-026]|uniref:Uncharacterized protein n=1 Tax=Rhizopogon vinicolor AM-OR11-026 TaxID=1314800 RepID=A0A1B7N5I4_9AGAM|nr:hypothetical protein K503DRAFT_799096 [Rhizopogon vinicolor AM-OR11-026]